MLGDRLQPDVAVRSRSTDRCRDFCIRLGEQLSDALKACVPQRENTVVHVDVIGASESFSDIISSEKKEGRRRSVSSLKSHFLINRRGANVKSSKVISIQRLGYSPSHQINGFYASRYVLARCRSCCYFHRPTSADIILKGYLH
jgi:hypothetical protein